MLVNKCDICGVIENTMECFCIPMYGYKQNVAVIEGNLQCKCEKGIYPFNIHICANCQKKIANYIESIRTTISLD